MTELPTERVMALVRETGRTPREVSSALEFCNDDEEQAKIMLSSEPTELGALNRLNTVQREALKYVARESKRESDAAYEPLLRKFEGMGYTKEYLDNTLKYIRDRAPIIIHFSCPKVINFFKEDTHYRNQFETNTSGGCLSHSARTEWENRMFNGIYDSSPGFERVKYGVLNVVSDPEGVSACKGYGTSFMVLKDVRLRTTFASADTSSSSVLLSTPQFYAHILNSFSDEELRNVVQVANGILPNGTSSSCISVYKEIQIHGEIELSRHVEAFFVPSDEFERYSRDLQEVTQLHGIPIIPMETASGSGGVY